MTRSAKKVVSYLLKAGILLVAGWFIYRQFNKKNNDLKQFEHFASHISTAHVVIVMGLVVLLMFLNWFLEALKWRYVTKTLINISLWEAVEAVFCGLTWAVTTPNRLGEYGGRVMFLPPRKRVPGIFAMGVGSFSQGSVTNVLGVIAMIWFVANYIHSNLALAWGVTAVCAVIVAIQLVFYFHINWAVTLLDKVPFIKKYHRFFEVMGRYHTHELITIMGFSIARYITFSFQYFLVFQLLVPNLDIAPMMMMLMLFFLVSSAIPSLDLFDIGVRGFTASHLFVYVTDQNIAVIAGVSSIWLINLFIPAILGSLFVLKLKFFDRAD
ncbi:lysylphosphatidylglycerol synthase domain-containing protein [Mucilaginibacter sp. SMC90]|uniref:lysylphosphatidylglycerol synthase domain-containing protein n=1 Tax=Mucilaginibacter sp. SMC90 TaxID=2929803 RepID=UPI001FB3647D|nr:lysylphosphatidylglycerol synthase domain-containing protein [Mucilaginibacter sp. SMC90]UOE49518.1 lysylphosphatidylglycerol synthase domain-containing protein [Mucilaginibacter sp. SMC90]